MVWKEKYIAFALFCKNVSLNTKESSLSHDGGSPHLMHIFSSAIWSWNFEST